MKVNVESYWNGGASYGFLLSFRDSRGMYCRERIAGERWNRYVASDALNLLESVYGLTRRNVRFSHR